MNTKETAQKILQNSHVGTMATVEAGKPFSRYMTFFADGFTLYTATSKKTEKVDELESNPNTHILLGYSDEGYGDAYLEIAGTVTISDDKSLREKVWNDHMKPWFDGPEDPDLVILKVSPESIRLMNKKGEGPQTIDFA
ncbi:general stress protein 26 [Sporosarcina sp. NCCP-2716]|uniref:pyridoxamine 5'-phosphate oxidase family protein n=1 Tax=Sporosarcina sp. NCCP-2716 TaxID=2943679 RepID=UPI00203E506F|nr:pyridoxamine 5'-phosphate oxidase family protein [Sporosarcina sp. NCCP-2716]GKV69458.1 general stress protein 26 [Sporosarcina sp. NCCP-2716]